MYSLHNLEPVHCSMSNSNCCFLTCIQISQEEGKVVLYSHLLKNFPQFAVKGFSLINKAEINVFFFSNSFAFFIRGLVLKLTEWFSLIVPQSRPTLCDPMDCSTPGFPVHHQLSELTQTHVL